MPATDLERLVVQLSADIKKYESALNRAQGVTNQRLGAIQKKTDSVTKGIGLSFARAGVAIAAGLATGKAAQEILRLSEAATRIDNSLKVAGLSGAELEKVYQNLQKAALANGAPIETLAGLYSKVAQAQKELGVSSVEITNFSNNVALAMRVAGTDAVAASGSILQLGQALGSGTVHAEEFNSILEGVPTIAQAVAAGLKEAGGSVSQLKQLIVDGKVSSEAFFRAFEAGAPTLQQKVAGATTTVSQATTNLQTALIDVAREFNNSTGASERFAGGINTAAQAIADFNVSGLIEKIRSAKAEFESFLGGIGNSDFFADLNKALGVTDSDGNIINLDASEAKDETASLEKEIKVLQERIALNTSLGFDNTEALARLGEVQAALANVRAAAANMPATIPSISITPGSVANINAPEFAGKNKDDLLSNQPARVKPVSLASFPVTGGKGGGSGGGRKRGGGGGGGGESDYQREIEQIKERTAAVQAEAAAQASVNPLIDDYGYASERASAAASLLTAAQKSGLAVGKELKDVSQLLAGNFDGLSPAARDQAQAMLDLANGYATASAEAEQLAHSQDLVRQSADDFKSLAKDAVGGFISDLREGKSAAEALEGALDKVTEKLLDMALNAAFDGFGSIFNFGGGAFKANTTLGSFLTNGFDKGGYTGAGGKYQPAGVVHKGEYVFDAEATRRIGVANLRRLQGYASGGLVGAPTLPKLAGKGSAKGEGVVVNITNNSSAQISQQSKQTSRGTQIDVVVDELVADKMSTPGSRSRNAVQSQFGLRGGLAKR